VRGTAYERFEQCEIANIGGDADFEINMIELKLSQIRPEKLEIHDREENLDGGTAARFTVWMAIILRFSFSLFRFIMALLVYYRNLLHIGREN
jgi:hypothetical protein